MFAAMIPAEMEICPRLKIIDFQQHFALSTLDGFLFVVVVDVGDVRAAALDHIQKHGLTALRYPILCGVDENDSHYTSNTAL